MASSETFASVVRSIDYLRDLDIKGGGLYVRRAGIRIKLNFGLLRSAISAVRIYAHVLRQQTVRLLKRDKPLATIAFWPQSASPWYNIWTVAQIARLKIITDPLAADLVFVFEDKTCSDAGNNLPPGFKAPTINRRVNDISKQHVAQVFSDVFGYELEIDPLNYIGPAVRKSQINGAHDGIIIQCPLDRADLSSGHVYSIYFIALRLQV